VEKYYTAGQATDDNTTRRMRIACWITKATDTHTHSEYVILTAFHANNVYANAPQCYFYTMLPDMSIPVKADLRSTRCTQLCSGKLSISQKMYYSPQQYFYAKDFQKFLSYNKISVATEMNTAR